MALGNGFLDDVATVDSTAMKSKGVRSVRVERWRQRIGSGLCE